MEEEESNAMEMEKETYSRKEEETQEVTRRKL